MTALWVLLCCFGLAMFVASMLVLDMALNKMASKSDARLEEIDEELRQRG